MARMGSTTPKTASITMPTSWSPMPNLKCRSSGLKVSSRFRVQQKPANRKPSKMLETGRVVRTPSPNCMDPPPVGQYCARDGFVRRPQASTSTATHLERWPSERQTSLTQDIVRLRNVKKRLDLRAEVGVRHLSIICQTRD